MVSVQRTITVDRSLEVVVAYLKDFARAQAWDPGTKSCTRLDTGPIREGSTWHNVSVFKGRETELQYELVRLEPAHLTFRGRNKTATSIDDLAFRAEGATTVITYSADIAFHGIAKLAGPFLRREFERLGDGVAERMPQAIAAF